MRFGFSRTRNPGRLAAAAVIVLIAGVCCGTKDAAPAGPAAKTVYTNDFEKAAQGKPPEDFLILEGQFAVTKEGSSQFLRLAGDPVENDGFLAGPENPEVCLIRARIRSEATGKRFAEFGVGLGGVGGHKLWLMPATGELQILKDKDVMTAVPYQWKSGTWTRFALRLTKIGEKRWKLEGKAWEDSTPEPKDWMITAEDTEQPQVGRASLNGTAYSEKPIDFDDIEIAQSPD